MSNGNEFEELDSKGGHMLKNGVYSHKWYLADENGEDEEYDGEYDEDEEEEEDEEYDDCGPQPTSYEDAYREDYELDYLPSFWDEDD